METLGSSSSSASLPETPQFWGQEGFFLPASLGRARWHFQRLWGHARCRCHRPVPIRDTIPRVWQFPHPKSPREAPARAVCLRKNDESVFETAGACVYPCFFCENEPKICRQRLLSSSHMSAAKSRGNRQRPRPGGSPGDFLGGNKVISGSLHFPDAHMKEGKRPQTRGFGGYGASLPQGFSRWFMGDNKVISAGLHSSDTPR